MGTRCAAITVIFVPRDLDGDVLSLRRISVKRIPKFERPHNDPIEDTSVPLDCIGIGFGPANIALAIIMEEQQYGGRTLFLERNIGPSWQPGMLLSGADIQHNPLRDFVTPRNPRSRFGFLSYLHAVGRLFDFLNLDQPYPPRAEYAGYVRWVAEHFDHLVNYNEAVERMTLCHVDGEDLYRIDTSCKRSWLTRSVVFAPGRSPLIPPVFQAALGDRVVHASNYLFGLKQAEQIGALKSFAVIGASQSAVEIALDLSTRYPGADIHLIWRGQGIKLKDTSPFTEEIYFPEFVDYYHAADEDAQRRISADLWRSNYGAADHDVISDLYLRLYEQKVTGQQSLQTHPFHEVIEVGDAGSETIALTLAERHTGTRMKLSPQFVILASGYLNFGSGPEREPFHPLLTEIAPFAQRRGDGSLHIARDFRVMSENPDRILPPLIISGLCESTHGFGDAGSFSLLSIRAGTIFETLQSRLHMALQEDLK